MVTGQGGRKVETIKTAIIVILLMVVLYGVYKVLNKPQIPPSEEIAWHAQQADEPLEIELGEMPSLSIDEAGSDDPSHQEESAVTAQAGIEAESVDTAGEFPIPVLQADTEGDREGAATEGEESAEALTAGTPSAALEEPPHEVSVGESANADAWPAASAADVSQGDSAEPLSDAARPSDSAPLWGGAEKATAETETPSDVNEGHPADRGAFTAVAIPPKTQTDLARALETARRKVAEQQYREALFLLSPYYERKDITAEQRKVLLDLLDPLAGKVIYSREHLVEPAYEVRRGERLAEIAQRYNVPWQLLANINGISDPDGLLPGTKLKVVSGPFRAVVDLAGHELTLFVGPLYAGRFPITVGNDPAPRPGEYQVQSKLPGRTYYAGDGRTIPAGAPENPYGHIWIDLGNDMCIHGSGRQGRPSEGCISLSPIDANDVFGILSRGSKVIIRR